LTLAGLDQLFLTVANLHHTFKKLRAAPQALYIPLLTLASCPQPAPGPLLRSIILPDPNGRMIEPDERIFLLIAQPDSSKQSRFLQKIMRVMSNWQLIYSDKILVIY
jgi:hypothetical protein